MYSGYTEDILLGKPVNWQDRKKVDSKRKAEEFEANKNFKAQNAKVVCVSLCVQFGDCKITYLSKLLVN